MIDMGDDRSMKGYGEFEWVKYIICVFIFISFFMITQTSLGAITIEVTGQPQIDILNNNLNTCTSRLDICNQKNTPECVCNCDANGTWITGFLFGIIIGFIGVLYFTIMVKPWVVRKIKEKMSENNNIKGQSTDSFINSEVKNNI